MSGTLAHDGRQAGTAGSAAFVDAVERCMVELLSRRPGPVSDAARESVLAGGKRLRPLLVLAARPRGAHDDFESLVRAGAAVELLHTASLIHDDVLDHAELRRGTPTVVTSHGERIAVAAGDLLFSLAFRALVECAPALGATRALAAVQVLAGAARTLATGEALQERQAHDPDLPEQEYLRRCEAKTGVLFGAALHLGALVGGAADADCSRLDRYGRLVGVAFQVTDDVLDCLPRVDAQQLGKLPGADVRDGTMTLPLLLAAAEDPTIRRDLRGPVDEVDELLARVQATSGPAAASDRSRALAAEARELLEPLAGRFDVESLGRVARLAVERLS